MPFVATWIDLEMIILSEVNQRQISYYIIYMWNMKKSYTNELIYKTERFTNTQSTRMVTQGERVVGAID